ncbi:PREDICTED: uncharacterized protein LOC101306549 [Fragaria vesca subsp. vesca]
MGSDEPRPAPEDKASRHYKELKLKRVVALKPIGEDPTSTWQAKPLHEQLDSLHGESIPRVCSYRVAVLEASKDHSRVAIANTAITISLSPFTTVAVVSPFPAPVATLWYKLVVPG